MPTRGRCRDDRHHSMGCKIQPGFTPAPPHKIHPALGPWRPAFHPPCWRLSSQRTECIKHGGRLDRGGPGRLSLCTLSPGTIHGPLWPVTLTTHTPSFYPPLFLCHPLPLPLCYCAPWTDNCPRIVYVCLWNLHCASEMYVWVFVCV